MKIEIRAKEQLTPDWCRYWINGMKPVVYVYQGWHCFIACSSSGRPTLSKVKPTMNKSTKTASFVISVNGLKNSASNSPLLESAINLVS